MTSVANLNTFITDLKPTIPFIPPENYWNKIPTRLFSTSHYSLGSDNKLSHVDNQGRAQMVDVSHKKVTVRKAIAEGKVYLSPTAFLAVKENKLNKGEVLTVAQLAGICGAKQTSSLIPLCHPIFLTHVQVELTLHEESHSIHIKSVATATGTTGVEMEALTAISIASLTVYDMCKAIDKSIRISDIRLLKKTGGKSDYGINNTD